MLNPSRPVLYDEGRLQVEVQSEFHESSMSEERNRRVLEDSLHAALGVRPALVFSALKKSEEPGGSEAAAPRYDDARATEANDDPIELVKKDLGAEVVDQVPH